MSAIHVTHKFYNTNTRTIMKLIIKILLGAFVIFIIGITAIVMLSDIEITQNSVIKTVPSEKILTK